MNKDSNMKHRRALLSGGVFVAYYCLHFSWALFYKRMLWINATTLKYAFTLGTLVFLAISNVTIGLKYTTVSNAGFSFGLAVIYRFSSR